MSGCEAQGGRTDRPEKENTKEVKEKRLEKNMER